MSVGRACSFYSSSRSKAHCRGDGQGEGAGVGPEGAALRHCGVPAPKLTIFGNKIRHISVSQMRRLFKLIKYIEEDII